MDQNRPAVRPGPARAGSDLSRLFTTAAYVTALVAGGVLTARWLDVTDHLLLAAAAAAPYAAVLSVLAVALFAVARRWIASIAAALLTATAVAVQAPLYVGTAPTGPASMIRVLTANLYEGRADAGRLVDTARDRADVLALQELTPDAVHRLSAAGLDSVFPFRWIADAPAAEGVGVWSRYPLHTTKHVAGFMLPFLSARIDVPGIGVDPTILVAHISGPWPQPIADWRSDMTQLPNTLRDLADQAGTGCVIAAGDLNSTLDMDNLRAALSHGYQDAATQASAGLLRTYPANSVVPPAIGIDHVLTRNCPTTSAATVAIPGSDHRGVIATVSVPR